MTTKQAKHIFVTGGVVSSLGKGLNCASIGMLLERCGLRVMLQKVDPYVNVDPGTMNPYEHGEVYVTDDGAETDLDLGHYTRFTNAQLNRNCNFTTGSVYSAVIQKEREGEFLGKTVQVIPHITDEIKERIRRVATPDIDVVLTEVGGIVGDIESLPFLEAIRQLGLELGRENCLYVHLTLVPFLRAANEVKTKPTQHSVGQLRQIGIFPDILICRTERSLSPEHVRKISLFCNVERQCVIEELDAKPNIYQIPIMLHEQNLDRIICDRLGLTYNEPELSDWRTMMNVFEDPAHSVEVGVVGKYQQLKSAYESIFEALIHGGLGNQARVRINRIDADDLEHQSPNAVLGGLDGILVPGGFGHRGIEGKVRAVQYARENRIPYFGICLGMQCAVIEFARHVAGLDDANSTEFKADTQHPVICLLEEQKSVRQMGGSMRLGSQPCTLAPGTFAEAAYGTNQIHERHRHRYEFNVDYRDRLTGAGMRIAGVCPDRDLVEIIELPDHPWFVAVQFHPEFKSKPTVPHPLFAGFIKACLAHQQSAVK